MKIKLSKSKYETGSIVFYRIVLAFIMIFAAVVSIIGTGPKPLLLIPIAICISMNSRELPSAVVGTFCGLLLDVSCNTVFGYNAVIMVTMCVATSLIFTNLLREHIINAAVLCTLFTFLHGALDFLFYYKIWGYNDVDLIFSHYTLPSCILTSVLSIPIYFLIKFVRSKLEPHHVQIFEEPIE